jgi:hypothetical protein
MGIKKGDVGRPIFVSLRKGIRKSRKKRREKRQNLPPSSTFSTPSTMHFTMPLPDSLKGNGYISLWNRKIIQNQKI